MFQKTRKGGRVIGSGGFGCIFRPALACKKNVTLKNGITKLQKRSSTLREFEEIKRFLPILETIPHYEDYFLISNVSLCEPKPLQKEDLVNFNAKCNALSKQGIFAFNVNKRREELLGLTMPDGGVDALDFIEDNLSKKKTEILQRLNLRLLDLLEHGLLPMNERDLYHCDIKAQNVLVSIQQEELKTRIIDWGLSSIYHHGSPVPEIIQDRTFQYNLPFSNILFSKLFREKFVAFFSDMKTINYYHVKIFVIEFVTEYVKERGPGHIRTMNKVFATLYGDYFTEEDEKRNPEFQKYDITFHFVFEYLIQIILAYTDTTTRRMNMALYFETVFLKNVDVWGFLMCYLPFLELFLEKKMKDDVSPNPAWFSFFKHLFLLLLKHSDTAIPVEKIPPMLKEFDSIIPMLTESMAPLVEKKKEDKKKNRKIVHPSLKKKRKKKFHRFIVRTLKNIQAKHSKNMWY